LHFQSQPAILGLDQLCPRGFQARSGFRKSDRISGEQRLIREFCFQFGDLAFKRRHSLR